jgi:hypothetical protein
MREPARVEPLVGRQGSAGRAGMRPAPITATDVAAAFEELWRALEDEWLWTGRRWPFSR